MVKRYTALALILCMMWSMMTTAYAEKSSYESNAVDKLSAFGIIQDEYSDSKQTVTRGEFIAMLVRMLGLEEVAQSTESSTLFRDVPYWHKYASHIRIATQRGMIDGAGDGLFEPDTPVTYEQAIKFTVSALGYGIVAKEKGGYPSGYSIMAQQKGILKGVAVNGGEALTIADGAQMIYNALSVFPMVDAGTGNYYLSDKTVMDEYLSLYKGTGTLTGTKFSSIYGTADLDTDEVSIDLEVYKKGSTNPDAFLGKLVEFYYKVNDSDRKELVYIEESNNNKTLKLDLSDVTVTDDLSRLIYYDQNDKSKTVSIEGGYVIYNGKRASLSKEIFTPKGDSAFITLTDTDNNNSYDIIEIYDYKNYIINQVNTADKIIYPKDGAPLISMDADSKDTEIMLTDPAGKKISISSLNEGDVISVAESIDKDCYKIVRCGREIVGTLSGIRKDNGEEYLIINGKEYKYANSYKKKPSIGYTGNFPLDAFGKIAGWHSGSDSATQYAYLIDIGNQNVFGNMTFKLFNRNGEIQKLESADTFIVKHDEINTVYKNSGADETDELKNLLARTKDSTGTDVNQLVIYKTDSNGKLRELEIAKSGADDTMFSLDFTKATVASANGGYIEGSYRVDSAETTIFSIPDDRTDDSKYKIISMTESASRYKDMKLYDVDENSRVPAAVVYYQDQLTFTADAISWAPVGVISEVSEGILENGEEANVLKIYLDGMETEISLPKDKKLKNRDNSEEYSPEKFTPGDVMQLLKGKDGSIVAIQYLYNMAKGKYVFENSANAYENNTRVHAIIKNVSGDYLIIVDDKGRTLVGAIGTAKVYVVNNKMKKPVRLGSKADLFPGGEVVIRKSQTGYNEIILFEK